MSFRVRKILALFLIGWLLVLSGGYAGVQASEPPQAHEQAKSPAPGKAHAAGDHACAEHLSAELLLLESAAPRASFAALAASAAAPSAVRAPSWHTDPLTPPPDALA